MVDGLCKRTVPVSDQILEALARPTTLCAFCPKMCRSACPVSEAEGREATTPWGKMSLVHLARTQKRSLADQGAQTALQACTGCGACVEKCAHGNPVAETLFAARAVAQAPRTERYRSQFLATGDVKGRNQRPVVAQFAKDPSATVAYFPGCSRCHHDGSSAIARDLRALSRALGHDVAVVDVGSTAEGSAQCCGYPLYVDGQLELVEDNLVRLAELLAGHQLVVTPDPGCAYMLTTVRESLVSRRGKAPSFPSVLPLVEVLAQHASQFAGASEGLVLRYHDPCYLARRGRTFDAPRRLIAAATGMPPLEFEHHGDDADCSGSGGLYPQSNGEGARAVALRRVRDDGSAHIAVDAVVTACPSARRGFERASVRAFDIVDVILGETSRGQQ